jgi:hypothetical protein
VPNFVYLSEKLERLLVCLGFRVMRGKNSTAGGQLLDKLPLPISIKTAINNYIFPQFPFFLLT